MDSPRPRIRKAIRLGSGIHVFGNRSLYAAIKYSSEPCCEQKCIEQSQFAEPKSELHPASALPTEVWLLVLAWSGLRASATAAACCSTFRDHHRTISSTPCLLARALLADHGPDKAAAHLYCGPGGEPQARHSISSDNGIAATIQEMLLLSTQPHGVPALADPTTSSSHCLGAAKTSERRPLAPSLSVSTCRRTTTLGRNTTHGPDVTPVGARTPSTLDSPAGWSACVSPVVTPHASALLRAAAAAGHVRVAATAMELGARLLDGALVGASGCGRQAVVGMLLAKGADPNASEPFGPCALFEAARNGHISVAELLLDAGANIDGVTDLPPGYDNSVATRLAGLPDDSPLPGGSNAWLGRQQHHTGGGMGGRGLLGVGNTPVAGRSFSTASASAAAGAGTASSVRGVLRVSAGVGACSLAAVENRKRERSSDTDEPRTPTRGSPVRAHGEASAQSSQAYAASGNNTLPGPRLPPPLRRRPRALPMLGPLPHLPQLPSLSPLTAPLPYPQPLLPLPLSAPLMLQWPTQRSRATPLLAACQGGHMATVLLLLRRGARFDMTRGTELLMAGHPAVVDALLGAAPGLSVHLPAALVAAASGNRAAVVAALLRHGANPAASRGMALNEAAYQGHAEVVKELLQAGGPALRECGAVAAALQLAQRWGRSEVAHLLMSSAAV